MRVVAKHFLTFALGTILFVSLLIGFSCGPKNIEVPDLTSLYGVPLDKVGVLPLPSRPVSKDEMTKVFNETYQFTLMSKTERVDKEQIPCHSDYAYKACVKDGKIIVAGKKTGKVAKTVEIGDIDYLGDFKMGNSFFTVALSGKKLYTLYLKNAIKNKKPVKKLKKSVYSLEGLDWGDKKISIAIKNQAVPTYSLWIVAVEKEELVEPLFEIDFFGLEERQAFVKQLMPASLD